MEQEDLLQFIDSLEIERTEQAKAYWFDLDRQFETMEQYDKAIQALKNIAYLQFDVDFD